MKKYIMINVLFMFFVFFSISTIHVNASMSLVGRTIILDAGHGGKDPGTIYSGLVEKDVNLAITRELKNKLVKRGAIVLLVRDGDYDLSKPMAIRRKKNDFDNRIRYINNYKYDMYLSIHINYLDNNNYDGIQVFYDDVLNENEEIAKVMQSTINDNMNNNRDYKLLKDSIYMYNKLDIKGVLIECGFISNYKDREKLNNNEYISKLSMSIADGVLKYFNT